MTKFTLERDNPSPLTLTVDQISERFMDRKKDGSYWPAPTKLILTKLNSRVIHVDPETVDPETEEIRTNQTFVGGDRIFDSHASVSFLEGLKKGVYAALYQTEFT